ncbi:EAL domain-containing protein [Undibacterium sp. LX40W]|uniref:EAL domain-containing protein n=1 Tax=Undibacterium nitidum TaxID=2762298 RepID=A0A923HWP9_9BURK|nr:MULTISPECIES: EAL domain-containing protein [Undibacterium]MBC3881546.1 EAL domain-containing protein [Undibacterium nitidum]MBC3891672.1 EAL domain-containing protein [Undibacterium sp. LX40W]
MDISRFNFQNAPCGLFIVNSNLELVVANQTLATMLDFSVEELNGKRLDALLTSAYRLVFHMQVMTLLHVHGHVEEIAIVLTGANGKTLPVIFNAVRREIEGGAVIECVVIRMNERQSLEDELFRVKKATEQVPGAIYQFLLCADGSSRFPYASEGVRDVYELSPLQLQKDANLAFKRLHPDDLESINLGITESAKNLTVWHQEYRVILPKKGLRWLEGNATPESRSDGSTLWHGYIKDITERKALELTLSNEFERTRVTLNSIGDAVITTNEREEVEYLNPIAEQLTGWKLVDAIGLPVTTVFNIVNQHTRLTAKNPIAHCLEERAIVGLARDTVLISKDGNEYAVEDSAAPIFSTGDVITGVVMVFRDVTGQRILRQEVERRASHDHLTGLANRAEFDRVLLEMFESSISTGVSHALCCIDLDQFKIVNDSCGHSAGDALLKEVSALLVKTVRSKDVVARLGGDEFAILLEGCDLKAAHRISQQVCDKVAQIRFQHGSNFFRVGASIGVVPLDGRWESAQDAQQAADGACFAAKDEGRGRVHIYVDLDKTVMEQRDQMQWATRLPQAIDENRFELFAQPIMPLGEFVENGLHFEVLLRMRETDGTLIPPGVFIPSAERFGLAPQVDRWVVNSVFEWLKMHADALDNIHTIAINLSGKSVGDRNFHQFLVEALDRDQIPAHKISFEITETAAIGNMGIATEFIAMLHERSARISLDDFGSGMSSMAYLKHLRVDYLKIDGQFVKDMANDAVDCAMVRSINEIAHLTGKFTIAEFVENENILKLLEDIGVDFAQGYYIGKPKPINEIFSWRHF